MKYIKKSIIDCKKFKRFFFYGIEDIEKVKEGFLCFSANKVYKEHLGENLFDIPNYKLEKEIIEEASTKYKHIYRFVILNDENKGFNTKIDMNIIQEELEKKFNLLKQEKIIFETKAGVFFRRESEIELNGGKYYEPGKGVKGEKGWTKQIYEITEELDNIEKQDIVHYYEYWLIVKFARAINRANKEEILEIKKAYEELKKHKTLKNEERGI